MTIYKLFTFNFLLIFFLGCNENPKKDTPQFSMELEGNKTKIQLGEQIRVTLNNPEKIPVDSVVYEAHGQRVPLSESILSFVGIKPGYQTLHATVYYKGKTEVVSKKITVLANTSPKVYTYTIVNEYPHDVKAYTQGLEFYRDTLYESTGRNGQSSLRKVNYKTGDVLEKIDLDTMYFGEGITVYNDKIYQLTWQNKTGFIYDVNTFTKTGSFAYGKSKEGWGLCNNGKQLYKSDGTEKIWILNPDTLVETDYIQTVTNTSVFNRANELEYVDGKIYANVYLKESMMIIDAETGIIEGVVNFGGLKNKVTQHPDLDVLNGIAYNPKTKTIFVTGKNWDKLFEVTIAPRQ